MSESISSEKSESSDMNTTCDIIGMKSMIDS